MARPRSFDLDEAADRMLDIFWDKGFQGASVADLSAATGLLPGSLYAAFGSKDEMFRLAMARYATWLVERMPTDLRGLAAIETALERIVELTVADPDRRGCPMLNASPEAHALSHAARADIAAGLGWMQRFLAKRLREAGMEPGEALDRLAALLFAATVSIRVLGRAGLPEATLRQIAAGAIQAAKATVVRV